MEQTGGWRLAIMAVVLMAVIGVLLIFLFPGSPEQDIDYHFLMARTAWVDHFYFVDVWGRPLFTALFAPVAWLGFVPARFFALAISVVVAWQTYRLANDLRLSRAWLVIPFLLGQQTFFELYSNLFTEPLFALVLVVALRCHISGRIKSGMLVASLLPLARPEGVFVGLFWGLWILGAGNSGNARLRSVVQTPDFAPSSKLPTSLRRLNSGRLRRAGWKAMSGRPEGYVGQAGNVVVPRYQRIVHRLGTTVILGTGVVIWWFGALLITGDPLFILHNWPATWRTDMYGHGTFLSYGQRSQEFAGAILIVPLIVGLVRGFRSWSWSFITSVFLVLFLLHSIFVKYGLFGEAGFPRYMVSVAPAIGVLTLDGWNRIFSGKLRRLAIVAGWVVVTFSILQSVHYLDAMGWARDAVAIDEMADWLRHQDRSSPGLIWSNGRMCIVLNGNLKASPPVGSREKLLATLDKAPAGTIVFWDSEIGPSWFGTTAAEMEGHGYQVLSSRHYSLPAVIFPPGRFPWMGALFPAIPAREIELSLLRRGD